MDRIYIVTSLEIWNDDDFKKNPKLKDAIKNGMKAPYKSSRSVAWFPTFEQADKNVRANACDIYEFSYDYAVIEETPPGYYPIAHINNNNIEKGTVLHFYKYNKETEGYDRLEKCPDCLRGNPSCLYYGTIG